MSILQRIKKEKEVECYWESLLGRELLHTVLREPEYEEFLEQEMYLSQNELREFLQVKLQDRGEKEGNEWIFYPFYHRICCYVQQKLDKVFRKKHLIFAMEEVSYSLAQQYVKKMQDIPLRCLLQEMEELRQGNRLLGETQSQEYEFFLKEYLSRKAFVKELAEKYPVMMELVFQKTEAYVSGLKEMLFHLEQEKEWIESRICRGQKIKYIQEITTGLSDEHSQGKSVCRILFDNGMAVYYKTRTLKPELEYQRLYHWICRECGLENYNRGILDCGSHGWEGEAAVTSCLNVQEVKRYYERMGIHLCLSYLFGVSDIHFENIIAHGEYPVLIDMEVFPGYLENASGQEEIQGILRDSVLNTGILPGQSWGNEAVNISAMGSRKKQKSPFKVPVIKDKNTSHMHIAYEQAQLNSTVCIPKCRECSVEPEAFADELQKGFDRAYQYILVHKKKIIEEVSELLSWKSRYVIRHTQQYRMYQMTASFPEFMADARARRLILLRMEKGLRCKEKYRKKILLYEAEAVMQGMIPVYYVNGRHLELGDGTCIPDYFKESPKEQVIARLNKMSEKDRYRQQKFIALSMAARNIQVRKKPKGGKKEPLTAHGIVQQIQNDMELIAGKARWLILKYGGQEGWQFEQMGPYLYDGIAGIAVFLMAYGHVYGMDRQRQLRENTIEQLFSYTEEEIKIGKRQKPLHTGIMNGESSIVYAYLVLYQISGEERFLTYAKKHARIVEYYLEEDRQSDLLEGNAGSVIAMAHLHCITGQSCYLEMAQHAAQILISHKVSMEQGIGWCIPGQKQPLAGMAHGNSGIMMAFARLYQITGKACYHEIIELAREYEDSLYDQKTGNWQDMRNITKGHGKDVIAWCHGAAGILMAAANMDTIMGIELSKDWHLKCAKEKIILTEQEQFCLCHGKMGNAAALRYGNQNRKAVRPEQEKRKNVVPDWEEVSDFEKYQMGLMTGLSGMGYELLKRENTDLPEILALE